ncbi:hypothetical protein OC846_006203 [Tilletia horrida]|uniref:SH3 domain-containing protein n=1 Tax=Tilletia horrida TaxID=155126 RepID=A0AAN6JPJ4_9BASI|nr:hypothetical protein OC846_006203 [Tilletia horrida]KAK0544271.1 hypothetical protein OC845_005686 [Tilletia horrida]
MQLASTLGLLAVGIASLAPQSASAQTSTSGMNCVSLKGSTACPAFQDAYVNPQNLSKAWPWFTAVNDVQSFDEQFNLYFTDPTRYHATKFNRQLQCNSTAAQNTTLQYQRTILCGQFSQISYSAQCNLAMRANPIMVCQDTCLQYAGTENGIVTNPQICTPDDQLSVLQNSTRYFNLNKDYVTCTNWTTLVSANNATCVEGITNEGNCGWGPDVNNQLCAYCDPSGNQTVPACCYDAKTNLSQCSLFGYPGAASVRPTTSVAPTMASSTGTSIPTSSSTSSNGAGAGPTGGNNSAQSNGKSYSGGQIAGIVIGCVVGALLLGLLLGLLCFRRRNDRRDAEKAAGGVDAPSSANNNMRSLNNAPASTTGAGGLAGGAAAGTGAAVAARDSEKGGWTSPFRDEKVVSPSFTDKDYSAGRPGSSALGTAPLNSTINNSQPATGGRFSPSSGSGAAGVGAAALLGGGAAAAGAAASRATSSTPTQANKDGAATTTSGSEGDRPLSALSNSTATDGRGTTVPAVRDQYSGLDIQPNDEVVAIYPYSATLTDEMNLEVDDVITVLRLYDDGWALGRRAGAAAPTAGGSSSNEGAFPLVCVTSAQAVDGPASRGGMGTTSSSGGMAGASSDDGGLSAADGGISDSVDGAVTADEGAVTADEGLTDDEGRSVRRR